MSITKPYTTTKAPLFLRLCFAVLSLTCLQGCFYFGSGDRTMVSLARDQIRRAGEKATSIPSGDVIPNLKLADQALSAVEKRHGKSNHEWPPEEEAAHEDGLKQIGAYEASTAWWQKITGSILGFFVGSPLMATLITGIPVLTGLLALLLRKAKKKLDEEKQEHDADNQAMLEYGDKVAEKTGASRQQKLEAASEAPARVNKVYRTYRKGERDKV